MRKQWPSGANPPTHGAGPPPSRRSVSASHDSFAHCLASRTDSARPWMAQRSGGGSRVVVGQECTRTYVRASRVIGGASSQNRS